MLPPNLASALAKGTVMSCLFCFDSYHRKMLLESVNIPLMAGSPGLIQQAGLMLCPLLGLSNLWCEPLSESVV